MEKKEHWPSAGFQREICKCFQEDVMGYSYSLEPDIREKYIWPMKQPAMAAGVNEMQL